MRDVLRYRDCSSLDQIRLDIEKKRHLDRRFFIHFEGDGDIDGVG